MKKKICINYKTIPSKIPFIWAKLIACCRNTKDLMKREKKISLNISTHRMKGSLELSISLDRRSRYATVFLVFAFILAMFASRAQRVSSHYDEEHDDDQTDRTGGCYHPSFRVITHD